MKNIAGLVALCIFISTASADESSMDDIWGLGEDDSMFGENVVISATRFKQAEADAPAAISIIKESRIRYHNPRNIVELLRIVP